MKKYSRNGTYKVVCDRSGFIVDAKDCKMQWNGLFVRKELWEERHPQDMLRPVRERLAPPIPRPIGESVFLSANEVTAEDL